MKTLPLQSTKTGNKLLTKTAQPNKHPTPSVPGVVHTYKLIQSSLLLPPAGLFRKTPSYHREPNYKT